METTNHGIEKFLKKELTAVINSKKCNFLEIEENGCNPKFSADSGSVTVTFQDVDYVLYLQNGGRLSYFRDGMAVCVDGGDYDWTYFGLCNESSSEHRDLWSEIEEAIEEEFGVSNYSLENSSVYQRIVQERLDKIRWSAEKQLSKALKKAVK